MFKFNFFYYIILVIDFLKSGNMSGLISVQANPEESRCGICLEPFESKDKRWSHVGGEKHTPLHKRCLQKWFQAQGRPYTCPIDRVEVNPNFPRSTSEIFRDKARDVLAQSVIPLMSFAAISVASNAMVSPIQTALLVNAAMVGVIGIAADFRAEKAMIITGMAGAALTGWMGTAASALTVPATALTVGGAFTAALAARRVQEGGEEELIRDIELVTIAGGTAATVMAAGLVGEAGVIRVINGFLMSLGIGKILAEGTLLVLDPSSNATEREKTELRQAIYLLSLIVGVQTASAAVLVDEPLALMLSGIGIWATCAIAKIINWYSNDPMAAEPLSRFKAYLGALGIYLAGAAVGFPGASLVTMILASACIINAIASNL